MKSDICRWGKQIPTTGYAVHKGSSRNHESKKCKEYCEAGRPPF